MTETESAVYSNTITSIIKFVQNIKTDPRIPSITEWATKNRFLPSGTTEHPGFYDPKYAPYTVELQECLHPDNTCRIVSILKSTQSLGTTTIENAIGHSIRYGLHNILYVISDLDMAKMRSTGAIDVLIDFGGLQDCVKPITKRDNQRKSGDTILFKEFSGGRRFLMTSYHSIAKLKSFSWDLIIMDEIDEAPFELKGQGDPEAIIEKRGQTIRDLKVCKISTPSNSATSRIWRAYKSGDRREYMIPCPRCGGFQHLEFMRENLTYGLYGDYTFDKRNKASLDSGSARYKCKHCQQDFYEYEKKDFMLERSLGGLAYWEPTATAQDPRDRSYHISAMMSPMTEWSNIVTDFIKTDFGKKLQDFKNFTITNEGLPYISSGNIKPWTELKERALKEALEIGVVQPGGLILVGGADVQKKRIECQIVAYGQGMEVWSVEHHVFFGDTADVSSSAWQGLRQLANKTYQVPGIQSPVGVLRIGVDVSYNPNRDKSIDNESLKTETHSAYTFIKQNPDKFIAIRGDPDAKFTGMLITQKRHHTQGIYFYLTDVSAIKDEIMQNIDIPLGSRAIHFPVYDDEFFRQFLSEIYHQREDGKYGWDKLQGQERNETWDTFIYARAVAEREGISHWSDDEWEGLRIALS